MAIATGRKLISLQHCLRTPDLFTAQCSWPRQHYSVAISVIHNADRYNIDTYRLRMSRISSFYFGGIAMYRKMTGIECNATI
jgi:hypothetical protein